MAAMPLFYCIACTQRSTTLRSLLPILFYISRNKSSSTKFQKLVISKKFVGLIWIKETQGSPISQAASHAAHPFCDVSLRVHSGILHAAFPLLTVHLWAAGSCSASIVQAVAVKISRKRACQRGRLSIPDQWDVAVSWDLDARPQLRQVRYFVRPGLAWLLCAPFSHATVAKHMLSELFWARSATRCTCVSSVALASRQLHL